jgi:hypothetical protein
MANNGVLYARDKGTNTWIPISMSGPPGPQGPVGPVGPSGATTNLRVTHPNTDDVLVETFDTPKNRWQMTHYDSGNRQITTFLNGWTGQLIVRRINHSVYLGVQLQGAATFANPWVLPLGFRGAQTGFTFNGVGREANLTGSPVWYVGGFDSLFHYGGLIRDNSWQAGYYFSGSVNFPTDDLIPTSLPGVTWNPAPATQPAEP